MPKEVQAIDIGRASESLAGMVADWYGDAPLPNARISADVIAQRLNRFVEKTAVLSITSAALSEAIAVLRKIEAHAPDVGVDEFHAALNEARDLIARAEGR